jgi:nitroreductase
MEDHVNEIMTEIQARRAYRALIRQPLPRSEIELMIQAAHLAPSCFNYQPWRFVAVDDPSLLAEVHKFLGASNRWMTQSPVLVAVCSRRDLDCKSSDNRDYFLLDTGMAVGFLLLQATRMGYVAHPVAGYQPVPIKLLLKIPENYTLITLINIARHGTDTSLLDEGQRSQEKDPRIRKPTEDVFCWNQFALPEPQRPSH